MTKAAGRRKERKRKGGEKKRTADHHVVLLTLPSPSPSFQSSRFLLFPSVIQAWREVDAPVDKGER